MSDPALSVAFFDRAQGLHGTARAGLSLLFDGATPTALPEPAEISAAGDGYRAVLGDRLDLSFSPLAAPADLGGAQTRVCAVSGRADGREIAGFGTVTETAEPPVWAELDALRGLSAVFDERTAVVALARRPRGAPGHGDERVRAFVIEDGRLTEAEETRISTVYDADGRQRDVGVEMWLPEEDFPRRAAGVAVAGASLDLEAVRVHAAVFDWRMEGARGIGGYEITARLEPPAAA